ncbi:unnamed protein product [Sphagnum jensenii]|uniref:VOC domain-containing protein n=1 Tax=Sphagnum jensenii TaxID=128206 RepID=A0ABP0V7D1_9BRYO
MNKIEHIGIAVRDIAAANETYTKLLGHAPYKSEQVDTESVETSFFRTGESKIELLQATAPDSAIAKYIEKRGEGIHHIAFATDDIELEVARMVAEGFQPISTGPKRGADNKLVVLREIYAEFDLGRYGIPSYEAFHTAYLPVNGQYWAETLRRFQVFDIPLATAIARHYTERSPFQTALFPEAIETLEYLRTQYDMHIITNGFEEIQGVKIRQSRLEDYFRHIFISEKIGHQKPEKEIFLHAMQASGASPENSLMIGDNMQTDIAGAQSVGMDQVFFNPQGLKTRDKATYEIRELKELRNIL